MLISFKDAVTGERYYADEIHPNNEFLCISKREAAFYIFNVITGKPYLRVGFASKELAMQFGKLLHGWYGEYFWIWKAKGWENVNIVELVQHTIPNGIAIKEAIEEMKTHATINNLNSFSRFI